METTQVSIMRLTGKEVVIHTIEYYSAIRKKEILPLVTMWMDFEDITPSEINLTEKDKYYKITLTHGILKIRDLINKG